MRKEPKDPQGQGNLKGQQQNENTEQRGTPVSQRSIVSEEEEGFNEETDYADAERTEETQRED